MIVYCIAGLPGSGKTMLGKQLAEQKNAILLDDMDKAAITKLREALLTGQNCVITDVNFCRPNVRALAEKQIREMAHADASIAWVFFENAPDKCRANVARRQAAGDNRKVEESIKLLSKIYEVPQGQAALRVWGPKEIYEPDIATTST